MPRVLLNQEPYLLTDLESYVEGQRLVRKLRYEDLAQVCGHSRKTMTDRIKEHTLDNKDLIRLFTLFDTDAETMMKLLKEKK